MGLPAHSGASWWLALGALLAMAPLPLLRALQWLSPQHALLPVLRVFCQRPGRLLSRDQLIDLTQGRAAGPNERSIDILVVRLRRKIEPDPQRPDFIKTVRSGGYMFTPDVEASQ